MKIKLLKTFGANKVSIHPVVNGELTLTDSSDRELKLGEDYEASELENQAYTEVEQANGSIVIFK